jgi:hypothetical protein
MRCENNCIICKSHQDLKVNYSNYHGVCIEHITKICGICKCIYCGSFVPILISKNMVCLSCKKINTNSDYCEHSICNNCLSNCFECKSINSQRSDSIVRSIESDNQYLKYSFPKEDPKNFGEELKEKKQDIWNRSKPLIPMKKSIKSKESHSRSCQLSLQAIKNSELPNPKISIVESVRDKNNHSESSYKTKINIEYSKDDLLVITSSIEDNKISENSDLRKNWKSFFKLLCRCLN